MLQVAPLHFHGDAKLHGPLHFWNCRNPTLTKCGGEAQHLEKVGIGVLRDSRKFRRRFGRPKHLALGCSWCHWKGLQT